eukprot:5515255-Amphidinium_carterae.2
MERLGSDHWIQLLEAGYPCAGMSQGPNGLDTARRLCITAVATTERLERQGSLEAGPHVDRRRSH